MGQRRIGLKEVRALRPGQTVWDCAVVGFGARRQRSNAVSYVLIYRTTEGRQRWYTIGRHGSPWTPETARSEARRLLGIVAAGADPAAVKHSKRKAATVAELCDLYLADAEAGRFLTRRKTPKKSSTLAVDRGRIERHIKPLLGQRKVSAVTREDVEGFMHEVAIGKTAGNTKTRKRGLARVRGGKAAGEPCRRFVGRYFHVRCATSDAAQITPCMVARFADGKRERRLSDEEYKTLGKAMREAEGRVWPPAIALTRFLVLTGWRRGEAVGLSWDQLDLARRTAVLADTKTGRSIRPLSHAACEVLGNLPRLGNLVFLATRGEGTMAGFPKLWARLRTLAGLSLEVTPHTLRHSFASHASDLGFSEATIAALVGHKGRSMTSRYTHAADAVLLSAADAVADRITALLSEVGRRHCDSAAA